MFLLPGNNIFLHHLEIVFIQMLHGKFCMQLWNKIFLFFLFQDEEKANSIVPKISSQLLIMLFPQQLLKQQPIFHIIKATKQFLLVSWATIASKFCVGHDQSPVCLYGLNLNHVDYNDNNNNKNNNNNNYTERKFRWTKTRVRSDTITRSDQQTSTASNSSVRTHDKLPGA